LAHDDVLDVLHALEFAARPDRVDAAPISTVPAGNERLLACSAPPTACKESPYASRRRRSTSTKSCFWRWLKRVTVATPSTRFSSLTMRSSTKSACVSMSPLSTVTARMRMGIWARLSRKTMESWTSSGIWDSAIEIDVRMELTASARSVPQPN
jgi:hypothetical protein